MATLDTKAADRHILNSWKEIAEYLGRGVRTVQRWERDLALPVRRPRGKSRSAVFAVPEEINAWIASRPQSSTEDNNGFSVLERAASAAPKVRRTIQESRLLWSEARQRRKELSLALQTLVENLQQLSIQNPCETANGNLVAVNKQDS